jgi:hypothetical protein
MASNLVVLSAPNHRPKLFVSKSPAKLFEIFTIHNVHCSAGSKSNIRMQGRRGNPKAISSQTEDLLPFAC